LVPHPRYLCDLSWRKLPHILAQEPSSDLSPRGSSPQASFPSTHLKHALEMTLSTLEFPKQVSLRLMESHSPPAPPRNNPGSRVGDDEARDPLYRSPAWIFDLDWRIGSSPAPPSCRQSPLRTCAAKPTIPHSNQGAALEKVGEDDPQGALSRIRYHALRTDRRRSRSPASTPVARLSGYSPLEPTRLLSPPHAIFHRSTPPLVRVFLKWRGFEGSACLCIGRTQKWPLKIAYILSA
jgi:hypothetical protein